MKRFITLFATLVLVAFVPSAVAASGSLIGGATISGNQVKLVADVSDTSTANDFSGINFTNTGVTTFSTLRQLATKFNVTDDDCGAGSPRFQINFGSQNAFVYLGPSPTFRSCTPNTLVDSGNLIGNNDACRWDTSQLQAGTQCNTYAGALTLLGSRTVTGIQLVVDASWLGLPAFADKEQTVLVCDIRINGSTVFPCHGAGGGQGGQNVTICHRTKSTKHPYVRITVSQAALPAHMKHNGDIIPAPASGCPTHVVLVRNHKIVKAQKHKRGGR
jgi:hypothetical protein